MPQTWRPTGAAKLFTSAKDWSLTLDGDRVSLVIDGQQVSESVLFLDGLHAKLGLLWATVQIPVSQGKTIDLEGLPNKVALELVEAVTTAVAGIRHRHKVAELLREFSTRISPVVVWAAKARQSCKAQLKTRGWLTADFRIALQRAKPNELQGLLDIPEIARHVASQPADVREAIGFWQQNLDEVIARINQSHLTRELTASKDFFDQVEKSPLTEEQARAVICFDNRILLVAAAGSGKTSTLVAKAGYALKQGYVAPEQMLLLAFNQAAASELRERLRARLVPLGLPGDRVVAKTFHAFGLDVIGQATGKRPSLAPWVESGRDLEALLERVDDLKGRDLAFRTQWDLLRVVFSQDLPKFGQEHEAPDAWDSTARRGGFWTLNNDVVKSRGEQLIANWLFYNGVRYVYEAPYRHDTADAQHRQYRPDFFLPDADAYLEHWALDAKGEPPPAFTGYKEGMAWKRQVHATHQTTVLETTMAQLWSGQAFHYLAAELARRGVTLDPDPDRAVPGRRPIENARLARTFRSLLIHAKSNRLSVADLRKRLQAGTAGQFRFRHEMFLGLFEKLWNAWEDRLQADRCIDFEDMLNLAADCVEQGRWTSPYELVMVDEFQDASQARVRLVKGLVQGPGKHLFAVGDDWQSINRFAGSDLSVMTHFQDEFANAVRLNLDTTFRCPQSLCDLSSRFVQKNPQQLRKVVRSARPDVTEPVRIVRVEDEARIRAAVEQRVAQIAAEVPHGQQAHVYLLGRYQKDAAYLPAVHDLRKVALRFITVHASKGLEADHVILPRMSSETLGFPSQVADDPVLQLAMPEGETCEHAEERRLFYVALTRARSTVTLITLKNKESVFITELARDHRLKIRDADGEESRGEVCPACQRGFLTQRKGKYGPFLSCSTFPKCDYARNLDAAPRRSAASPARSKRSPSPS